MERTPFLLQQLPDAPVPAFLLEKTLLAVQAAQRRQLYKRLIVTMAGVSGCLIYGLWESQTLRAEFSSSAFVGLIQLAISDPDILLSSLKDFCVSLLEALPVNTLLLGTMTSLCVLGTIQLTKALTHKSPFSHLSPH